VETGVGGRRLEVGKSEGSVASSQFQVARINDEVGGWWFRVGKSE